MSIGDGMAITAMWAMAAASMFAPRVTGVGMTFVLIAAAFGTAVVAAYH